MSTFSNILSKAPTETERPKPLPVGSYQCVVKGLPRFDKSTKKQTDFAEFTLQFQSALEDVDEENLAEVLNGKALTEKSIKATYYLTEDALWRFKKFLEDCGLDVEDGSKTYAELINEAPNCVVGIHLKHTPSDDGETMYANISKTFKIE